MAEYLIWLDPIRCPRCGLVVTDRWVHATWHEERDESK